MIVTFAAVAVAQPGPGGNCEGQQGNLEFTTVSDTVIEASLTGDFEGLVSLAVTDTMEFSMGPFSMVRYRVEGTVDTAGGSLDVHGIVRAMQFTLPSGETASFTRMRLVVSGGSGDFEEVGFGVLRGRTALGPMGMSHDGFRIVLCTPDP